MRRVKKRIYSGVVCEQIVYSVSDRIKNIGKSSPRVRFKTEEERAAHRIGIARRRHARIVNENFSPASLYSTLTMDDEHEVHTFSEARRLRSLFRRRLQYAFPSAKIIIYMGRGKSTHRIHFHMLSDGIPAEFIEKSWQLGSVKRIETLREHNYYDGIDYGRDYTGLANYLFDHWTSEQGGHYYMSTRNMRQPEEEDATEVKRNYTADKPPRAPKGYELRESRITDFGYLYYKYIKIEKKKRGRPKGKRSAE